MHRFSAPTIVTAIALAALAGFVDSLAYISLGGFFASFMSGNTTRLGIGIATHAAADAWTAASLLLAFVTGTMAATIVATRFARHRRAAVMATVTIALALAALLLPRLNGNLPLLLLAFAMGTENGVFARDGEIGIGLTYMTGTLVRVGQKLADALLGRAGATEWLPHLALWIGFAAGAVLGADTLSSPGQTAFWFAAAASAVLTALVALLGLFERQPAS